MADLFPRASDRDIDPKSDATDEYNCISWAVWHQSQVIWPDVESQWAWPTALDRNESLANFEAFFALLEFSPCSDGRLEEGYEKIVLYAENGMVTHAARLQANGRWTSKLGAGVDAEHVTPEKLANSTYGSPVRFMKRAATGKPRLPDLFPKPFRLIGRFGQGLIR